MKDRRGTVAQPLPTALAREKAIQQTSPSRDWIAATLYSIFATAWWSITYGSCRVRRAAYLGPLLAAGPTAVSGHFRPALIGNHTVAEPPAYTAIARLPAYPGACVRTLVGITTWVRVA